MGFGGSDPHWTQANTAVGHRPKVNKFLSDQKSWPSIILKCVKLFSRCVSILPWNLLLLPENTPKCVWRPGCACTRWGGYSAPTHKWMGPKEWRSTEGIRWDRGEEGEGEKRVKVKGCWGMKSFHCQVRRTLLREWTITDQFINDCVICNLYRPLMGGLLHSLQGPAAYQHNIGHYASVWRNETSICWRNTDEILSLFIIGSEL